ncbi:MAG: ribulose-phosphate 3-epimerase [Phycisphaerales bacterium JB063]
MLDFKQQPARPLVAASILSADFGEMAADCRRVLGLGADLLHVDVMDGHFAQNLTMGVDMIRGLRRHLPEVYLDVHLMVERPGDYVEAYAKAGANNFAFHVEVCDTQRSAEAGGIDGQALIDRVHALGMHAGMVVNPATPIEAVEPYLASLDLVLVMSVVPGRSGQAFMPEVLDKARWLADRLPATTRIEMDGGLSPTTAPLAAAAGVDTMVTASALFGSDDPASVIAAFHACEIARSAV